MFRILSELVNQSLWPVTCVLYLPFSRKLSLSHRCQFFSISTPFSMIARKNYLKIPFLGFDNFEMLRCRAVPLGSAITTKSDHEMKNLTSNMVIVLQNRPYLLHTDKSDLFTAANWKYLSLYIYTYIYRDGSWKVCWRFSVSRHASKARPGFL